MMFYCQLLAVEILLLIVQGIAMAIASTLAVLLVSVVQDTASR